MRLIHVYLTVYFVLLLGAIVVLWQSGALGALPPAFVAIALVVSVCLGLLLAVVSARAS